MASGIGMFAEAEFDPVAVLERVEVPILAVWGEHDRTAPPAESARVASAAVDRPDGPHLTVRIFPDASHSLRPLDDGVPLRDALAPDYSYTVAAWVSAVAAGHLPPATSDRLPQQARTSQPLGPLRWWESPWVQLAAVAVPLVGFFSYPVGGMAARLRRRQTTPTRPGDSPPPPTAVQRTAAAIATTGLATLLGFHGYYSSLVATDATAVGPVLGGRPLVWIALQLLAAVTCGLTALLAARWAVHRTAVGATTRRRVGIVALAAVVFAGWAAYWGLLHP